mmetsp:Transcript_108161/g.271200  ORF Transcript_108161/g.271200 Transcript_108161/m.271200 type:complete len:561 (+) Transcript_108161:99-1781(+)
MWPGRAIGSKHSRQGWAWSSAGKLPELGPVDEPTVCTAPGWEALADELPKVPCPITTCDHTDHDNELDNDDQQEKDEHVFPIIILKQHWQQQQQQQNFRYGGTKWKATQDLASWNDSCDGRDKAATCIQAFFRGEHARKSFALWAGPALARGYIRTVLAKLHDLRQHEAAVQLQIFLRGRSAHKHGLEKAKHATLEKQTVAAIRIQACCRRHLAFRVALTRLVSQTCDAYLQTASTIKRLERRTPRSVMENTDNFSGFSTVPLSLAAETLSRSSISLGRDESVVKETTSLRSPSSTSAPHSPTSVVVAADRLTQNHLRRSSSSASSSLSDSVGPLSPPWMSPSHRRANARWLARRSAAHTSGAVVAEQHTPKSEASEKAMVKSTSCPTLPALKAPRSQALITPPPGVPRVQGSSVCPFVEISASGLRNLVNACNLGASDLIYDVGCGKGNIMDAILSSYPCQGVAVDINASLARCARKRLQVYGSRVKVVVGDVRHMDMSDATAVVTFFICPASNMVKSHFAASLQPGSVWLNYAWPVPGWKPSRPPTDSVYRYVIGDHL